jgi:hypothetical protein
VPADTPDPHRKAASPIEMLPPSAYLLSFVQVSVIVNVNPGLNGSAE